MKLLLLVSSLLLHSAAGRSSGAGACFGGTAAVGGSHLLRDNIVDGALSAGSLEVSLDGVPLVPGTATDFTTGVDHTLTMTGSFKGFLFRLEGTGVDTTSALVNTDSDGQVATIVCVENEGVGGVTHTNPIVKTSASATLRLDQEATGLALDVTSVIINQGTESEYYYSGFVLNAVAAAAPTDPPVTPPTDPPVASPTDPPVASPTDPPVASPTDPPVASPTDPPVATPTTPPTSPTTPPATTPTPMPTPEDAPTSAASRAESLIYWVVFHVGCVALFAL